jgi:transposase
MRQLAEARAVEPWLREGSSSVQRQALRDFDRAMAAFFDPQNPAGKPSFRSKRGTQGFVIRDTKVRRVNRNHAMVVVPKCGWVRFRVSRDLPAGPGMARVTCDRAGRWHVSFPAPRPPLDREPTGAVIGIDRGVRTALVTSDGQHYRSGLKGSGGLPGTLRRSSTEAHDTFTRRTTARCRLTATGTRRTGSRTRCLSARSRNGATTGYLSQPIRRTSVLCLQ